MKERIIFRLPETLRFKVDEAIKEGKAKNPSELVRLALENYFKEPGEVKN
jgi:metal-responsive CopG/Arc/MetJ family transcriptional regulator